MVPGKTGLLFAQDDWEGIVAGVRELLRDRRRRAAMARAGKAFVLRLFDPSQVYQETLALYRCLLRGGTGTLSPQSRPAA